MFAMNSRQSLSISSAVAFDNAVPCAGPGGRRHRPRSRSAFALVGLATLFALAACGNKDQHAAGPGGPGGPGGQAMPVTVIEARPQRVPITVDAVGQSEGSKEVQVRARVSGILLKQNYSEGDSVKAGAVLFRIDPVPYEIQLAQAKAALAQARATLDQSQREEERLKPLAADQAVSVREYDTAVSTRKTSAAQLMAREADVRNADLNVGYTRVVAPIGGVSGRAISSEGTLVTAGTDSALLTTISQTNPIWVRFAINESEYATLRSNNDQDAKVELILPDGKTYPNAGKLNFAASTVDRTLGTVQLRAEVANPDLRILPGQFVRARAYIGEIEGVLVPQVAVMTSDKGKAVMVVGPDNKVTPRPVEAGAWQGDQWVIRKGLNAGDQVIVDNLVKLRPGMPVAPHPAGQGPGGAQGDAPQGGAPAGQSGAGDSKTNTNAKQ
jgi:membrane fusion protein (multidrug efflux system)